MLEIRSQKAVCGSVLGYLITTHSIPAAAHLSLNWFAKCHVLLGYAIPLQPSSVGEEHGMEPQFMYPVCTLWNCSFYHFTVRLLAHPSWHYLTWIKRIYSTLYYTIHCHTVFEKTYCDTSKQVRTILLIYIWDQFPGSMTYHHDPLINVINVSIWQVYETCVEIFIVCSESMGNGSPLMRLRKNGIYTSSRMPLVKGAVTMKANIWRCFKGCSQSIGAVSGAMNLHAAFTTLLANLAFLTSSRILSVCNVISSM